MRQEPTLPERQQMTGQVLGILSIMSSAMGAYHGYRRNQSLGWGLWWALMGGMFPVITPAIALAQGFGSRRSGLAGLQDYMPGYTRPFRLAFTCTDLDARNPAQMRLLRRMKEEANPVTYSEFAQMCEGLGQWASAHGYSTGNERGGLRLSKDPLVGFFRSVWGRTPCYFMDWSRIEHVWLPGRDL